MDITTFTNSSLNANIRIVKIDGEPWFVAADVLQALGIVNITTALSFLGQTEVSQKKLAEGRSRPNKLISESGLYKLIMRSDKPAARKFQDWVTGDVLPSIRKNGAYIAGQEKLATGEMSDEEFMALALQRSQGIIDRLKTKVEKQATIIDTHLSYMTVDEFFALKHIYPASGQNQSLGVRASRVCKQLGMQKRTQRRYAPHMQQIVEVGEYPVEALEHAYRSMVTDGRIPANIPQMELVVQ